MSATARLDIAITDRNPHVREFLCRELSSLGHTAAALAGTAQLLEAISGPRPPQVLVLDPEAAGPRLAEVERRLAERAGTMLVLLHVFEGEEPSPGFRGALIVEKASDIGALKAAVKALATQLGAGAQQTQERT